MLDVKAVISIDRRGEEKPYKTVKTGYQQFKKQLADFLGLKEDKEQPRKLGLGSFDIKLYRLEMGNGKECHNI